MNKRTTPQSEPMPRIRCMLAIIRGTTKQYLKSRSVTAILIETVTATRLYSPAIARNAHSKTDDPNPNKPVTVSAATKPAGTRCLQHTGHQLGGCEPEHNPQSVRPIV